MTNKPDSTHTPAIYQSILGQPGEKYRIKNEAESIDPIKTQAQGCGMATLWLWRNFVNGRPEYWAFDNSHPCAENGDPLVLGEPCGYAVFKPSVNGGLDISQEQVVKEIKAALERETRAVNQSALFERAMAFMEQLAAGHLSRDEIEIKAKDILRESETLCRK